MKLLYRPREPRFIGEGTLSFGTYDDTGDWEPIYKCLEKGADEFPDKKLFRVADREGNIIESFTWSESNAWANRIANGLIQECGVKKGNTVGIYMLNSSEFVVSILAIHKAGGVQVPINKDEMGERLAYIVNYSDQEVLITDGESFKLLEGLHGDLENLKYIFVARSETGLPEKLGNIEVHSFDYFDKFGNDNPNVPVDVADTERCMFTSGTTGMPKGVSRNHGGVVLTIRAFIQIHGVRNGDVLMSVLSLSHANAQVMCLFASIGAGAECVFYPRFSASNFWKWCAESGATITNMLGSVSEYVWAVPESEFDQKHKIRTILAGPAPKNKPEFEERFNTRVIDGYGSTEMGMVFWQYPEDNRAGSCGFVCEGYYVEIRDPDDTDTVITEYWDQDKDETPPENTKGLLFIKPLIPNTTLNEYFKDEKRTAEAFDSEGFFNSDDLFIRGIEDRYYFQGRYSRIRVSGENVDPNAVANYSAQYPQIQNAVAVGIRLPNISDDEIKLNIMLKDNREFDHIEFCKWMAEKVPIYMIPRFIEVYDKFPLTSSQKFNMELLKELSDNTWDRNESELKFKTRK
jgi:crotonobetaine/carnitine-CoA ligase